MKLGQLGRRIYNQKIEFEKNKVVLVTTVDAGHIPSSALTKLKHLKVIKGFKRCFRTDLKKSGVK